MGRHKALSNAGFGYQSEEEQVIILCALLWIKSGNPNAANNPDFKYVIEAVSQNRTIGFGFREQARELITTAATPREEEGV